MHAAVHAFITSKLDSKIAIPCSTVVGNRDTQREYSSKAIEHIER